MGKGLEPVKKTNIVDQIIARINDSIISGQYRAGEKLPNEYELMEELQVSRNSLREAFKILSAMGIIEIRRGDGTYVCSEVKPSAFDSVIYSVIYDMSTNEELVEMRRILDESILHMAIRNAVEEDIRILHENLDDMEAALNQKDYVAAQKLDYQFHLGMIDACKNQFFIRLMKSVYGIFEKSIIRTVQHEKEKSMVIRHHREILECLENRNEGGVTDAIAHSHDTWKEQIK